MNPMQYSKYNYLNVGDLTECLWKQSTVRCFKNTLEMDQNMIILLLNSLLPMNT